MEQVINNQRIAKNTFLLYVRMVILLFISLYTSRIVLRMLGVEDYGIYNVVGGVIALWGFLSMPLMTSTQRYLNYYMGRYDSSTVGEVFGTSVIVYVAMSMVILLLAETVGLWFATTRLTIPAGRETAMLWVYHGAVISSILVLLSNPFKADIIAHEEMGGVAFISVLDAILKMVVALMLSLGSADKLVFYAWLLIAEHLFITLLYMMYCRRKYDETRLCRVKYSKKLFKEMISFSSWNTLGGLAAVCFNQGTIILLNIFFGPAVNAAKGVSMQVQAAVDSFCANFQIAMNPQIVKSYAVGQMSEMHALVFRASKFSFFLVLVFALPIIIETDGLLRIWLVEPPAYSVLFVKYAMLFALIQSLATPLITSSQATGNVKWLMGVIATINMLIIPLGILAFYGGAQPVVIFQIQLMIYLFTHIVRVIIVSTQIKFSTMEYVKRVLRPVSTVSGVSLAVACLVSFLPDKSIFSIISCVLIGLATVGIVYLFGLSDNERKNMKNIVISTIHA